MPPTWLGLGAGPLLELVGILADLQSVQNANQGVIDLQINQPHCIRISTLSSANQFLRRGQVRCN
jgi:hypothetical protein